MADLGDYLGISIDGDPQPFGDSALRRIARIARVADDPAAVERLRLALVPLGLYYRRVLAVTPSELERAPGSDSHSERLEWIDTQILNPLKRLMPALAEDHRYMLSMWPQELRPPNLPDWNLLISNLQYLQDLAQNATLTIAFLRHHDMPLGQLLRYRIVSSAVDALAQALPGLKPSRGTYDRTTKGFNGVYPDIIRAIYKEITGEDEQLDRLIKEQVDEWRNPRDDVPDKPFVLGDYLIALASQSPDRG